jgi:radical SAM protein with 4Fe4S-binding SPASM domain
MRCTLTTGGWGVSESMVRRMADAGLAHVTVSVDGLEATHDTLRGRAGSWRRCLAVMGLVADAGMSVACNTQINRLSAPELPSLYEVLAEAGMRAWQTQLTGPMGHAADRPQLLLQPSELLDLHPMLARIARRAWAEGVQFAPAPNVGYYGPYERVLRGDGHPWAFWRGPAEGLAIIGIESDGSVKADATLPSAAYVAGNVRERSLAEIVEDPRFSFNRGGGSPAGTEHLWGFCRSCEFADLCRGDDVFTAHTFFGRRGNHPYCHHRALVHEGRGVRERLVPDAPASDDPYASGTFRIMLEPSGAAWAE